MQGAFKSGKPFLRWAGGKSWLARRLDDLFGQIKFSRYHEPFLGGGAVFFSRPVGTSAALSDKNGALIETYEAVRNNPERIIREMEGLSNTSEDYYKIRSSKPKCRFQRAAHFIYLNQTSFNGLYRVNLNGEYNVPFGSRSKPFLDPQAIRDGARRLQSASLHARDFMDSLDDVARGDFVFIDPPYTVSHNKNGFIKYNQSLFSLSDQHRLAEFTRLVSERGASYILTNAAHATVDEIFGGCGKPIELGRASLIGGRDAKRGSTTEYLFTNLRELECQS